MRFSVRTQQDGRFEMTLPAGKTLLYNLVAHDGEYNQWRNWANGVSEPFITQPGEDITDFKLWLSDGGIVRGVVMDKSGRPAAGRKVCAHAFDRLESIYYDPAAETDQEGRFEIKFVRPGQKLCPAVSLPVQFRWYACGACQDCGCSARPGR